MTDDKRLARYNLHYDETKNGDLADAYLEEAAEGEYVKYDDVAHLLSLLAAPKETNETSIDSSGDSDCGGSVGSLSAALVAKGRLDRNGYLKYARQVIEDSNPCHLRDVASNLLSLLAAPPPQDQSEYEKGFEAGCAFAMTSPQSEYKSPLKRALEKAQEVDVPAGINFLNQASAQITAAHPPLPDLVRCLKCTHRGFRGTSDICPTCGCQCEFTAAPPPQMSDETFLQRAKEENSTEIAAGLSRVKCPYCKSTDVGVDDSSLSYYCRTCTTSWPITSRFAAAPLQDKGVCSTCGHSNVNSRGQCRQCIDWAIHVCIFPAATATYDGLTDEQYQQLEACAKQSLGAELGSTSERIAFAAGARCAMQVLAEQRTHPRDRRTTGLRTITKENAK